MLILDMEQGTPEWHEARCGIVTSSRFKDVLAGGKGLTRASYMRELACERITGKVQDNFKSNWMERGNEIEPRARAQFILQTGLPVKEIGFCLMEENGEGEKSDIGASTDGLIGEHGVQELKCPKHTTHLQYLLDPEKLKKEYKTQTQGELLVTGREVCYLASYHPDFPAGKDLLIIEMERDEDFLSELQEKLTLFVSQLNDMTNQILN